jgi:large subunit ribosomal protein L5
MQEMRERSLMASRLKTKYKDEVRDQLRKDLDLENVMQVPRLSKIVVNMGAGDAAADSKLINGVVEDLRIITGQQPRVNKARKSVSNFKIREGQAIGASVTLRGERMWEFLDRLIALAIPRIRDFRGLSPKGFDGRGNYSFGVTEQLIFPEIDYDKVMKVRGMDITLVTTAETDEQGMALLDAFGFPFRRQQVGA